MIVASAYRAYFNVKELDDRLLKTYVTESIIQESSKYVEAFALSLGVRASDIATPTPYMVSRFAQLYAYMTAAQRQATFSKGGTADNDSFALKFNMYKQLLDSCEASLTADTFTNGQTAKKRKFPMVMSLLRN